MKYLFLNDIRYLKKHFKLFLIIIIMEILFQNLIIGDNVINEILGRNPSNIYDFIAILFYIMNICFYVYVILYVYSNDLTYNLENIFFRINPKKFIFSKIISVVFCIFLLRSIEYLIILPLFLKENYGFLMITMLVKDIFYYSFITIFSIFLRNLSYCIDYLYIIIILFVIIFVPKNINIYYVYYFIGIIVLLILNLIIMDKKCKYIFEKENRK